MLMSKVENQEGVTSFGQALANSLMVASNTDDFGVEISFEKLFLAQKLAKAEGLPRDSDVTLPQINTNMIQIMILTLGWSKELQVHHFRYLPSTSLVMQHLGQNNYDFFIWHWRKLTNFYSINKKGTISLAKSLQPKTNLEQQGRCS
ncbi:hypothetical protein ACLB2K_047385 [Fragaria x ananassa]